MLKNITIESFEISVTTRVLCDRSIDRETKKVREVFSYDELLVQGMYAANDLLKSIGLNQEIWARQRGSKVFLFCEHTRRIIAELAVSAENAGRGKVRRPRFVLLDRRGFVREKTVADLIVAHDLKVQRDSLKIKGGYR